MRICYKDSFIRTHFKVLTRILYENGIYCIKNDHVFERVLALVDNDDLLFIHAHLTMIWPHLYNIIIKKRIIIMRIMRIY